MIRSERGEKDSQPTAPDATRRIWRGIMGEARRLEQLERQRSADDKPKRQDNEAA